jgi:hypothetical protein
MSDNTSVIMAAVNAAESAGDLPTDPVDDGGSEGSDESGAANEGAPSLDTSSTPEPASTAKADATSKAPEPTPTPPEDELGPERDATGRLNRIPQTRVTQILKARERKVMTTVAEALGLAIGPETSRETFAESLKAAKETWAKAVEDQRFMLELEPIMASDGLKFLRGLAAQYPQVYEPILAKVTGAGESTQTPSTPRTSASTEADDPMPEPDYDLGEGKRTYSQKGLTTLMEWQRRQATREALQALEPRLKPIEEARQAEETRTRTAQEVETRKREFYSFLDEARKDWDGFTDHEADILAAMPTIDPRKPLEQRVWAAYRKVVMAKLAANHQAVRDSVVAEINQQPKTTGGAPSAVPKPQGPRTTKQAILDAVNAAEAAGQF